MKFADFCDEVIKDPYEFPTEDSGLWLDLLMKAKQNDRELFYILNYLRDVGATLVADIKYGYIIKPIIDPNGQKGWLSQKEYDGEKQYLIPYAKMLMELLKTL